MTSELEVLKQRIAELEARNAEVEAEKAELLKQIMEENTRRDVRVEESKKIRSLRLTIVEQDSLVEGQSQNDNNAIGISRHHTRVCGSRAQAVCEAGSQRDHQQMMQYQTEMAT